MSLNDKLAKDFYTKAVNKAYTDFKDAINGHKDRKRYHQAVNAVKNEFRSDLEFEYGVMAQVGGALVARVSQEKADKLFDLAWDRGHSSGYQEVALEYSELVDLVL